MDCPVCKVPMLRVSFRPDRRDRFGQDLPKEIERCPLCLLDQRPDKEAFVPAAVVTQPVRSLPRQRQLSLFDTTDHISFR